jgi:type VI secretion system secreted protein VgrG
MTMTASYTQDERRLGLFTPLGKDELLLTGFSGQEEMSRLFSYQLEMVSEKDSIAAKDIVGKNVTISLRLLDDGVRYFNGFVSRFAYCGTGDRLSRYTAEVVPWLWFLTKSANCRIFQKKTVVKIVEKVFADLKFTDYEVGEIKGAHEEWDYCVQYRETDFNFVSRLLEQEGIFYYFRHENGKHTLVLADQKGAYKDCVEKEVEFAASLGAPQSTDMITAWEHNYQFLSGRWAHTDFNFETPSASLLAKTNSLIKLDGMSNFEIYDFPGEYEKKGQGDSDVKLRMEEEEAAHDVVDGESKCRTFGPGGKFKIKKHLSKGEEGKGYVITTIHHAAVTTGAYQTGAPGAEVDYTNRFSCIPDAVTFRPARISLKPMIQGAQTAMVVGPAGEEIYTDKFGQVKVQFHWDREGKFDENSSCWIRVSHPWAGKGWGSVSIPRIGQEVIVDFLEGDPDRPIITGRVYNAEAMPPYQLPGGAVVSGLKSNTHKGKGANEMSMDDTAGKEKININAQYDMSTSVGHDQTTTVHNHRTTTVDVNDTESVGADQSTSVKSNQSLSVGAAQTVSVKADQKTTVGAGQELSVSAAQKVTVGGEQKVSVGGAQNITVTGARTVGVSGADKLTVGGGQTIDVTGAVSITSGASIELKVGGSSIKIASGSIDIVSSGNITVKGAIVKVNS